MGKRNRVIQSILCLILTVCLTGCQNNAEPSSMTQDTAQDMTQGMTQDTAQDMTQGMTQDTAQDMTQTESMFSFDREGYSYQGAKLSELQKQSLGNNLDQMVEAVVDAVNNSKEQVDLSAAAQNSQIAKSAIQIAAYIDPLTEIAVFEEESSTPGVFLITAGGYSRL